MGKIVTQTTIKPVKKQSFLEKLFHKNSKPEPIDDLQLVEYFYHCSIIYFPSSKYKSSHMLCPKCNTRVMRQAGVTIEINSLPKIAGLRQLKI